MNRLIAVYGSALVKPDETDYADAYAIGRMLAQAGYNIATGGYGGVMEAASKGAHEAGGHVVGIILQHTGGSAATNERSANPYLDDVVHSITMRERLHYLVDQPDGYVAMPGGVGTLQEIMEAWQQMRIRAMPRKPLIAYGDLWHKLLTMLADTPYVPAYHANLIQYANTPDGVLRTLQTWFKEGDE